MRRPGFTTEAVGLQPARHIAGFSIRNEEGTEILPIFDARVAPAGDSVILKLTGDVPERPSSGTAAVTTRTATSPTGWTWQHRCSARFRSTTGSEWGRGEDKG